MFRMLRPFAMGLVVCFDAAAAEQQIDIDPALLEAFKMTGEQSAWEELCQKHSYNPTLAPNGREPESAAIGRALPPSWVEKRFRFWDLWGFLPPGTFLLHTVGNHEVSHC
jgi:hypothetical protein